MFSNPIIGADSIPFKTASQTFAADGVLRFSPPPQDRGPNGGRLVVDGIDIVVAVTDYNVAGTAIQGPDLYRFVKRLAVEQVNSRRRVYLRGDALRQYLYHHVGGAQEYADSAVANDQTLTLTAHVPIAKPNVLEPFDFSMPVDVCKEVTIECGSLSELGVSGGTVTVDAATIYLVYWMHEEFAIILHAEDEVIETAFPSTSGGELTIGGRLQELLIYARGASGGAAMTNFTDISIDGIRPQTLKKDPDLIESWMRSRGAYKNLSTTDGTQVRNDPVGAGRGVPVLWTSERTSVFDGPLTQVANIRLTNTVSSPIAVHRNVYPKSAAIADAVMAKYRLHPNDFRVKTAGKSKRAPEAWNPELLAFVPLSAKMPAARAR